MAGATRRIALPADRRPAAGAAVLGESLGRCLHGARDVRSRPARRAARHGTAERARLRNHRGDQGSLAPATQAPTALGHSFVSRPRVLLVEDDERLSELVRSYLDGNGFDISIESRGDRVLARVMTEQPDLVVLDLGLPGRGGFEVCKDLRSSSYSMPILILTARNSDIDQVLGLELGADDYVVKPVEPR